MAPNPLDPNAAMPGLTGGLFDPLKHKPRRPHPAAPPIPTHLAANHGLPHDQFIYFYGQDPNDASSFYDFDVLCGDTPPTIIGGYAKQQVVDRPLYRGLVIFQGYDPSIMRLSVRFIQFTAGSFDDSDDAGRLVESDIGKLEWMAGAARTATPPPLVYLSTTDQSGNTAPLIPPEYQNSPTRNIPKLLRNKYVWPWLITALEWSEKPLRNRSAFRVMQEATVTVQLYSSTEAPPSIAHRSGKGFRKKALTFVSKPGADTPLSIAQAANIAPGASRFALADAITTFPGNKHLRLRAHSRRQSIRHGAHVLVPYSY